jgi:hypothetical protein
MSSLIAHHTWPIALGVLIAGPCFIVAWPRLYFRWLAHSDGARTVTDLMPDDAIPPKPAAPHPPALRHAAH